MHSYNKNSGVVSLILFVAYICYDSWIFAKDMSFFLPQLWAEISLADPKLHEDGNYALLFSLLHASSQVWEVGLCTIDLHWMNKWNLINRYIPEFVSFLNQRLSPPPCLFCHWMGSLLTCLGLRHSPQDLLLALLKLSLIRPGDPSNTVSPHARPPDSASVQMPSSPAWAGVAYHCSAPTNDWGLDCSEKEGEN